MSEFCLCTSKKNDIIEGTSAGIYFSLISSPKRQFLLEKRNEENIKIETGKTKTNTAHKNVYRVRCPIRTKKIFFVFVCGFELALKFNEIVPSYAAGIFHICEANISHRRYFTRSVGTNFIEKSTLSRAFFLARCKGFCRYFVSASACPPHAARAVPRKPLCAENVPPAPFLAAQTLSGSNPLRENR